MTYSYKNHTVEIHGLGIERVLFIDGQRANYSGNDPWSAQETAKRLIDYRELERVPDCGNYGLDHFAGEITD